MMSLDLTAPQIFALIDACERGIDELFESLDEDGYLHPEDAENVRQRITDATAGIAALQALTVAVRISNYYVNGDSSSSIVVVLAPALPDGPLVDDALDDWWEAAVFPLTGDGHHPGTPANYVATITAAAREDLVGEVMSWEV